MIGLRLHDGALAVVLAAIIALAEQVATNGVMQGRKSVAPVNSALASLFWGFAVARMECQNLSSAVRAPSAPPSVHPSASTALFEVSIGSKAEMLI
jgi:hypothetical protein